MTRSILNCSPQAPRSVSRIIPARRTLEGEGFEVRRAIPAGGLEAVGPFIFLDHVGPVDLGPGEAKGAPSHPHRGFETLTYVIEGRGEHRDSLGNIAAIGPGEAQWMRAGRGILHDEGPDEILKREGGRLHGVQFWINLPKPQKMIAPEYRAFMRSDIPYIPLGGGMLRLLAGRIDHLTGPVTSFANPWLAYICLTAGASVELLPEAEELGFYITEGTAEISQHGREVREGELALVTKGRAVRLRAVSDVGAFLLGGDPLDAPIRRWGPFVMNTDVELQEAMRDFQQGRFGRVPVETGGISPVRKGPSKDVVR